VFRTETKTETTSRLVAESAGASHQPRLDDRDITYKDKKRQTILDGQQ
jgi:hypothetical protein